MRLVIFLTVVACVHASAGTYAQKVSISKKNAPLEVIIKEISRQSGYSFIFNFSWMKGAKNVTINVKNVSVTEALDISFREQSFTYDIVDRTISLKAKPASLSSKADSSAPAPPIDVHGKVLDIDGKPLAGVTVTVKGSSRQVSTDENGEFIIKTEDKNAVLVFTSVNMETFQLNVKGESTLSVSLKPKLAQLGQVSVEVNTGYQHIPRERATGSFVQIDNELYNRRISPDILTKIADIAPGVYFNGTGNSLNDNYVRPNSAVIPTNKLGISIRGQNTLSSQVSQDPLIVLDNFVYEGDINNINPEMVESVTILKDAAAASIWGARAGNGVIVITTKHGRLNGKMKLDFTGNYTTGNRPNLKKFSYNFLDANDYINVEDTLFQQGYLDADLSNTATFPAVSPVAMIFNMERAGLITSADANTQINAYRNLDVRDDYEKYIYRKSANQQYGVTMSGGTNNLIYALSIGYDNVQTSLFRNAYNKFVINSNNTYIPVKNLEITTGLIFSEVSLKSDNPFVYGGSQSMVPNLNVVGGVYSALYPYAKFADAQGNHLSIPYGYNNYYIDSVKNLGFQDWSYRPLDELANANNTTKQRDLVLQAGAKYKFTSFLNLQLQYQDEIQSSTNRAYFNPQTYTARNYVNEFTQYTPGSPLSYPFPIGGILSLNPSNLNSQNARGQINYNQQIKGVHRIDAILGAELREAKTTSYGSTQYGYNDQYGSSVSNLDFSNPFPTNPGSQSLLPPSYGGYKIMTNRFISYYSNVGYNLLDRYTFTISGRKDGANIFGAKTNDKFTPLWSTGVGWNISKENFYRISGLPYLKIRATYGYNGNVLNNSAYLTATYRINPFSGLQDAIVQTPPNPSLRWEKIKNINLGVDFQLKNVLGGTVEYYRKQGIDLIEPAPLAPSTGFSSFNGNAAGTRTNGIDLTLNTKNINRAFKWNTTLLFSLVREKVTKYDVPQTAESIQGTTTLVGQPLNSILSYKWAGLDPTNGDPQGLLNGKVSKDYVNIINNFTPDSLVHNGSAVPTIFGSVRNSFSYKHINLSFNITYTMGYYFRRPSTTLNYTDIIRSGGNMDYQKRWQKPGDELRTTVPSLVYPLDSYRNTFYQYSQVLVEKGDNIRLQDVSLSYDISQKTYKHLGFENIQVFSYFNNIGIIWRANKSKIDPNAGAYPTPLTMSFGVRANL